MTNTTKKFRTILSAAALSVAAAATSFAQDAKEPVKPADGDTGAAAEAVAGAIAGDTHDAVAKDMMGTMTKMADILSKATDVPTAETAAAELGKLEGPLKKIAARMKALGEPGEELEAKLKAKYEPQMKEIQTKMMGAMVGLAANPDAMKPIGAAMERIGKIMSEVEK